MSTVAHHPASPVPAAHQPLKATSPVTKRSAEPLRGFDRRLGAWLGADIRLIYGMAVPIMAVIAAMIPMFLHPSYWLVGAVLVFELLCLGLVMSKVLAWLGEEQ